MRTSLTPANLSLATALLCVALAGCKPAQEAAPAGTAPVAAEAGDAAGAQATTAADGVDGVDGVDGDIIASTNEPFWNASVSGQTLVLGGIEGQRSLAIASSDTVDGTRTLVATDADGQVELKVTTGECQDTMSGAMFPFGAVLVIDGGDPVNGCARPASMPPPGKGL